MFAKLVSPSELLETTTFVLGGPRSGKSTLLTEYVSPYAAESFEDNPRLISIVQIRPYWVGMAEVRSRLAGGILQGTLLYSQNLPFDAKKKVHESLQQAMSKLGLSSDIVHEPTKIYLGDYWRHQAVAHADPLRWASELFSEIATKIQAKPCLLIDDADFQISTGILGELLYLCRTHSIGVLATARSLCESSFDASNPLSDYTHVANFICLDFLPADETFRSLCESILDTQTKSGEPRLKRAADRASLDPETFDMSVMLSGGQLGRFREFIQFMAMCQENENRWRDPSRAEINDFCSSRVEQMLQRENDSNLKVKLGRHIENLDSALGHILETGLKSTWLKLPYEEINEDELPDILSILRSGVLAWIFQCTPEDRINVAKQTRFVPTRFKISPVAGIAGRLSLKKTVK